MVKTDSARTINELTSRYETSESKEDAAKWGQSSLSHYSFATQDDNAIVLVPIMLAPLRYDTLPTVKSQPASGTKEQTLHSATDKLNINPYFKWILETMPEPVNLDPAMLQALNNLIEPDTELNRFDLKDLTDRSTD